MKKITDFLRSIGLLHTSKGDFQTGEFDDRKDIKESDAHSSQKPEGAPVQSEKNSGADGQQDQNSEGIGRKVTFWIFLVVAIFFLLAAVGSGWIFFLMIIVWGGVLYFLKQWAFAGKFSMLSVVITLVVVFIFSFIIIPTDEGGSKSGTTGLSGSGQTSKTSKTSTSKCEAVGLDTKSDDRITLSIVANEDVQEDHTKLSYTRAELMDLQYGYSALETAESYYVVSELCDGDKTLSFIDLEAAEWTLKHDPSEIGERRSGNHSQFVSQQSDGSVSNDIEEPGTYTLYGYISYDGKKWFIAQKHEFEVS